MEYTTAKVKISLPKNSINISQLRPRAQRPCRCTRQSRSCFAICF
ncbi:MAG: hypothetical protein ACLUSP_07755 [Christensenellales bacterium]